MTMDRCFCACPGRAVLAIAGEDRVTFLQALISNDVGGLQSGHARWAALLTPQGKYLADFFVVAQDDRLLLDVEAARAEDLLARLKRYKLRAKVALQLLPDAAVFLAWGDGARAAFMLGAEGEGRAVAGIPVFVDPRRAALGLRLLAVSAGALELLHEAGFVPDSHPEWDRLRIAEGVPDGTRDLVPEQSILLEAGFDELNGVSWTKGCYIGQELTARTKYRALIRKRLIPVRIAGPAPAFGTVIEQDGREVGEMRSHQGDLGLALLRLEALIPGLPPLRAGDAELTAVPPEWLKV
jgi:folate-binding protein YgfZ